MALKIKPLEWTPMPADRAGKDSYEAETPFGTAYTCTTTPKLYGWSVDHGLSVIHDTDDLSEAKAAAQADYETRILSAIEA